MAEENVARKRLGRGLAALLGDIETEGVAVDRARHQRRLPIEFLKRNPNNPRKTFSPEALDDLTASVQKKGIVQPILVRPVADQDNSYEIIAGERRWRAAQKAGLHEVPVVIHEVSDKEALEIAIVENVQRTDLDPIEEAEGYRRLIEEFSYTQAELAQVIGKSRSHVANTLRLMSLPDSVKARLVGGELTAGHARALITSDDPQGLAEKIIALGMTVRDAEALAKEPKATAPKRRKPEKDADTRALEKSLAEALGLSVSIDHKDSGAGVVHIKYKTLEQLDEISARLRGS